jgi:Kef-type K+ transport system membrane component KefB/voltage-gated potassium channel Kch
MNVISFLRRQLIFIMLIVMPTTANASGALPSLVEDIGICVVFAGILAITFTKLKIPVIAAFLIAGIAVGPIGAKLVTDPTNIETISELGLILLLFLIGLEVDIRKLLASGRILILTGLLQYPLCIAFGLFFTKLLIWMDISSELLSTGSYTPLYIGIILAASSTLLVVKLFQQSFQLDTETGRVSLGILIFQDIWAIGVIAIQPNFASPEITPILMTLAGAVLLAGIASVTAKYIIPIGFRWIAKMPEIIFVASISWCFIVVLLGVNFDAMTETLFGFNLHLAVGAEMCALIAGATIASLPYSTEIVGKVGVVKDFFVTLFFVGLGMSIPMPNGADVLLLAAILAALAIILRLLVFFPLLYFTGLDRRNSMVTSVRLAQISEFSLVIGFLGTQIGHISDELNSAIIFAFVLTALITPALFYKADWIHDKLTNVLEMIGFKAPPIVETDDDKSYSLALLGFHRITSSLLHEIGNKQPELLKKTLVVDFNVNIHASIEALGPKAQYGDLCNEETLIHAGVNKAKVIVCTIPDDILKGTTNEQIVKMAKHINPDAIIIANAIELKGCKALYDAGADFVFLQRVEAARAVEQAIGQALSGNINDHRSAIEAIYGRLDKRREVL